MPWATAANETTQSSFPSDRRLLTEHASQTVIFIIVDKGLSNVILKNEWIFAIMARITHSPALKY